MYLVKNALYGLNGQWFAWAIQQRAACASTLITQKHSGSNKKTKGNQAERYYYISGHTKSSSSHEENNSVSSPKNKLQPQQTKVNIIISFAFRHCAGRALIYILRIHSEWKKTHTIRRTPPIRSNQWLTLVPSHPPLQGSHRVTKLTLVLLTNLSYRQPLHSTRICRLHARGNPPFCIIRLESALQSDWTNSCRRAKQNQASLQQYWATPSTTEGHR